MTIAKKIKASMSHSSMIRKMFEEGAVMKKKYGADLAAVLAKAEELRTKLNSLEDISLDRSEIEKKLTAAQLLHRYAVMQKAYPLMSIEDPFAEDDWSSWRQALPRFADKDLDVVGDDFFVTNIKRLKKGIQTNAANAILIKLNQIGSLTETVDAINMAHDAGWATSISHRSGETSDTLIADLSVACGSEYIKTGSLSRSERVEKYNRLMEIEGEMAKD